MLQVVVLKGILFLGLDTLIESRDGRKKCKVHKVHMVRKDCTVRKVHIEYKIPIKQYMNLDGHQFGSCKNSFRKQTYRLYGK